MEDLWEKYKQETKEHLQKINEFLDENTDKEKANSSPGTTAEPDDVASQDVKQTVEETTKQVEQAVWIEKSNENSHASRKNAYGNLKDSVKEIMEKEHVSRAQAYRKAKKIFLSNSQ